MKLRAGNASHFWIDDTLVDVNAIISDYQRRADGADNHRIAQEVSKLRITAHLLHKGDSGIDSSIVVDALGKIGRGWMLG